MGYLNGDATPTPSEELKKLGGEVHNALTALRESTETKNADTLKKVEKFFEKYEDENSKLAKQWALAEKAQGEFKEKVTDLEKKLDESVKGSVQYEERAKALELLMATQGKQNAVEDIEKKRETRSGFLAVADDEYKSFAGWLTGGKIREVQTKSWDNLDLKTLRTDSESAGGYLIPQVMDNVIRKNIIEMSPVRAHARVRTSPSKTMDVPRRLAIPTAQFEGEAEAAPTDQSVYGSEQVTLYRQTVEIPATLDMMISSAFDLEREVASDVGESFAQGEGLNFVKGNGRKSPQGFISDDRCVKHTSGTSANFDFDDLAKFAGKLKRGQNPWWYMNRKTVAYIQALKSTIGVPIWMPVAGNQPATIWGFPYDSNMIDMDDVSTGSGAKPIAFADLSRGYEIFDMVGINVIRDDLTQANKAITKWIFRRYLTGRVLIPEAIGVMTLL